MFLLVLLACSPAGEIELTDPPDTGDSEVPADDTSGVDGDRDGFPAGEDCDDADDDVHPGAVEVCDEADNDCDTLIDEADPDLTGAPTWHYDGDGDGYGDPEPSLVDCAAPFGWVADSTDCDDDDGSVHPGAAETCNEIDDDCDGAVDEDVAGAGYWYDDSDGDGYGDPDDALETCTQPPGRVEDRTDCDDADPAVSPSGSEICDGIDNDCDGAIDDDDRDVTGARYWYGDSDGDGYGDPAVRESACTAPAQHVANSTDCDDTDADVNTGAAEVCDGIDDDCDGSVDTSDPDVVDAVTVWPDADGDGWGADAGGLLRCAIPVGYSAASGDCDETNADVNPAATEVCDDLDNDCDGLTDHRDPDCTGVPIWYEDRDGDGYGNPDAAQDACDEHEGWVSDNTDCDDTDASVHVCIAVWSGTTFSPAGW